jgi:AraC-like DNA-binding protein
MDWIQSIQHALNYIENHLLDEDLDNDSIARHSYSSNANFQRTFSIVTGVTIADYIRCRRLTLAGEELSKTDSKVIDAAFKYKYDSPESFSKAFTRFHGITPSEAKRGSNNLKCFSPIFLRIEVRGGFNMNTKMIPHVPKVFFNRGGENYHFNSAVRYVMDCIGEMKLADYSLIAGITGDIFVQFYSLKSFHGDSASDYYLGLRKFPSVFDKLGYTAESISIRELKAEKEKFLNRITASIDKGVPVILYHGGPPGVIVGYEGDGNTLLYLRENMVDPESLILDENFFSNEDLDTNGWVVTSIKNREVSLTQIYRDAIIKLPKLLTMKTDDYVFGAEAFRMWANDIENGKFDKINIDFFTYEVYVLNLATNCGGSQEFLEKAQELNSDFAFLADVRKQYRIMNYLWNGGYWIKDVHSPEEREEMKFMFGDNNLEMLGGAFGCKHETLQDKEKRTFIVKIIRKFADCMDEIVRILNENLNAY